jgi:hypothetical protein
MTDMEKRLDTIEKKLDGISSTLSQIAIQRDRIERLEQRMHAIWERYDALVGPEGVLSKLSNFQASCPRGQIRWVWMTLVPLIFTQLGIGLALLRCL